MRYPLGGATTVGLKTNNCVILASEKRLAYGGFIISKSAKKVFKITNRIGTAFAGLIADIQTLLRVVEANIKYYEVDSGRYISVYSAAKLLSNILYNQKSFPYYAETLVGGFDDTGYHLYVLDPLGSLIEDDYAAVGSGAPIAIGVIVLVISKSKTYEKFYPIKVE